MKQWTLCLFFLCVVLGFTAQAVSAQNSVVILPFSVQAPKDLAYLGRAVPTAFQTQFQQQGHVQARLGQAVAHSEAEAKRAMGNADYAMWGSVVVEGSKATISASCVDRAGKTWTKTEHSALNGMTGAVTHVTQAFTSEVLQKTPRLAGSAPASAAMRTPGSGAKGATNQRGSSDIIMNETGQQQYYLNPQFRYQGASEGASSRIRSQRLKMSMSDMAVADFNGDGKNEVAILDQHYLYMYVWGNDGKLKELGKTLISQTNINFSMRAIDLNRDGAKELVIATYDEEQNRPYTFFYSFKNNRFSQYCERCNYFCNVVKLSPTYQPTLVGQAWDSLKLFRPGVHQMVKTGNTFALGSRLNLPKDANVFNIGWLPNSRGGDGEKLLVLRDDERIKVYPSRNPQSAMFTTMDRYSGSAVGMEHYKGMPGLGIDKNYQLPSKYFAPMRFIAADIGRTGEYVLIINKPISTASQFFDRYRFFPQGEIHALYWDGVGLGLKWKTRRIRGSVGQIDLADINNDGILDLVVGLNSSPDLGIGSRQCMVTAYPLNTSATDPNAPIDLSDFEINPNP